MTAERFEEFRREQEALLRLLGPADLLIQHGHPHERGGEGDLIPVARLATRDPAPLGGEGPLRGGAVEVAMALRGLRAPIGPEDDADGFAIVEQIVTVRDAAGADLLAWRFGPNRGTLEVSGNLRGAGGAALDGRLLPTGFVALDEIVRLLIEGFGAPATAADWRERLDAAQGA